VGLSFLSGVGRQLISGIGGGGMGRGGMVSQKRRRVEGSTGMEVNTKSGTMDLSWTIVRTNFGRT